MDGIVEAVTARRGMADGLFDALRHDGLDPPGVSRDPYGAGEQRAHATVRRAAEALGLEIGADAAANLYMTWPGADRSAPPVVIGSHLDSVPHGGNFDGAAGVVAGLVSVAALQALGVRPACDVIVIGIRAEESIWFQVSYVGSRSALGVLPDGALAARRTDTGRTLEEHMRDCGADPDAVAKGARHFDPAKLRAFVELHIEQAPSLVEAGIPVGICTGIPGTFRHPYVTVEGETAHVGLPRRFRRDAAMAAADFAMAMDRLWQDQEARGVPIAFTMGRFHTDAAQHGLTVVPGTFQFSLDVRAYNSGVLAALEPQVDALVAEVEQRRGVRFHLGARLHAAVGMVDPAIAAALTAQAAAMGIATMPLGSPASHDAAAFAACGVPMGMIFVRNENGSHNPHEAMTTDDFLMGTAVLAGWLAETVT
jgi:N-carbamoyl-L-amino-acid hydrolase